MQRSLHLAGYGGVLTLLLLASCSRCVAPPPLPPPSETPTATISPSPTPVPVALAGSEYNPTANGEDAGGYEQAGGRQ